MWPTGSKKAAILWGLVVTACLCGLLVVCGRILRGALLLNMALVWELKGMPQSEKAFLQALEVDPSSCSVRRQAGTALKRRGAYQEAAAVLMPLLERRCGRSSLVVDPLISSLLKAGAREQVLALGQRGELARYVSRSTAAGVALMQLNGPDPFRNGQISFLERALDIKRGSALSKLLANRLDGTGEEAEAFRARLRFTLEWLARSQAEGSTPVGRVQMVAGVVGSDGASRTAKAEGNLVVNGDLEQAARNIAYPPGWMPNFWSTSEPWSTGLFVLGLDDVTVYEGKQALRIDCLAVDHVPDLLTPYAGFCHEKPLVIEPSCDWCLSFAYRTERTDADVAQVWVLNDVEVLFSQSLCATSGQWQRVSVDLTNRGHTRHFALYLLSFGEGSVWFDDIEIRRDDAGLCR